MTVEPIVKKILDDAKADAAQMLANAQSRIEERRKAQQDEFAKERQKALEKAKNDAAVQHQRMLSMAQLEERKLDLAMKRDVIKLAFEKALEKMQSLPVDQVQRFMRTLLIQAKGDEEIIIDPKSEDVFTEQFITSINKELRASGKAGDLKLSKERREIGAGCILSSGGVETNCTFAAILTMKQVELENEVASILFPHTDK